MAMKKLFYFLRGLWRLVVGVHIHDMDMALLRFFLWRVVRFSSRSPHISSKAFVREVEFLMHTFAKLQALDYDEYTDKASERQSFVLALIRFNLSQRIKFF